MPASHSRKPSAAATAATNAVRIIGGHWRSRVLRFPPIEGLRPTPDRVRETLFNWLGQDLTGLSVLDLFSGSGALAFEALSRGAKLAVAIETHAEAIHALRTNAATLGVATAAPPADAHHIDIIRSDAIRFLKTDRRLFDVIFIDPPFTEPWWPRLAPLLDARCAVGGWIYVEQGEPIEPPAGWEVHRQRQAGNVHYHLLRRRDA